MKTQVVVELPDLSKWVNAVNELTAETGNKMVENAVLRAPVNSGKYRSNITYDNAYTVTANANYSAAIEYGTIAHEITPKTAKALHFQDNGQDVFTKKVNHPGTKPNPVMRLSAKETQAQVGEIFKGILTKNGLDK